MHRIPGLLVTCAAGVLCGPAQTASVEGEWPTGCQAALQALTAQESALLETRRAASAALARDRPVPDALLVALRRRAAAECLGEAAGASATMAGRTARTPIAVPSVVPPLAPPLVSVPGGMLRPPLPATATPLPAPVPARGAPAVVACDALGCWTNDGKWLQRAGPQLLGPKGFCTLQGGLLSCPP